MDYHQNARLTIHSREQLAKIVVERGCTLKAAAAAFNVSAKTAAKWVRRYREQGTSGLRDRSSRPHRSPRSTSSSLVEKVLVLRRRRHHGGRIALALGLSRATVSRILRRAGLNRLRSLDPPPPVVRYEHKHPGDLMHFDIKRLARIVKPGHRLHGDRTQETRGAGYEYLHIAVDDHSRIAFTAMLPDETAASSCNFLRQAVAYFARLGITARRVMTDNGPCFYANLFAQTCRDLQLKHIRTRIYTPRTNGKAERFIQTAIREWAYARLYQNSADRRSHLAPWIHQYNWHRPHASLNQCPPMSRSGLDVNNLLRHHS